MRRSAVIAAAFALFASDALARCPDSPADTAKGLLVTYPDGITMQLTQDDQGMARIEGSQRGAPEDVTLIFAQRGYMVTEFLYGEDGLPPQQRHYAHRYPEEFLKRPALQANERAEAEIVTTHRTGETTNHISFTAGSERAVQIGDCAMRGWIVTMRYAPHLGSEPTDYAEYYLYLPVLGTAVLLGFDQDLVPTSIAVDP